MASQSEIQAASSTVGAGAGAIRTRFDSGVVLLNAFEETDRALCIEVGEHGLSLHDPAGALLRAVPLAHMTAWGKRPSTVPDRDYFVIHISEDLESFFKMTLLLPSDMSDALNTSMHIFAQERAAAVQEAEAQKAQRRRRSSRLSLFRTRQSSTSTGSPPGGSYQSAVPDAMSAAPPDANVTATR